MAINVICPGCHKRFKVSDKFAGKEGPCPQCKTKIRIPDKSEEVVVHAPEQSGPTDSTGRPTLKPIERTETKFSIVGAIFVAAVVLMTIVIALVLRFREAGPPVVFLVLGAILLGPACAFAAYTFLRDDELEPHRGLPLLLRVSICGAIYALLWGLYWFVPWYLEFDKLEMFQLLFVAPVMFGIGAFAALGALDLDYAVGLLHYGMYVIVTVLLCLLMGINILEFSKEQPRPPQPAPSFTAPLEPSTGS